MSFTQRLEKLINEKGITKNKMLIDLQLGKNSFVDWVNRNNIPSGDIVAKIAEYFNVSTDYLLGNEPKYVLDDVQIATFGDAREYTEAELAEIKSFVEFIKAKRSNTNAAK